jgi:glyoxylase-like metal-dependent hydrolase (beta-lactamase superfamily II)
VQLHFLGRGHTGGDTMVFLPAERIIFTGDFFEGRPGGGVLSYLGDSFIDEWPASLERLKAFDFDVIVPGHGAPLRERKQIDDFQNYLRDLWRQASALRAQGVTAEQAVEKIDLSSMPVYRPRVAHPTRALLRAYELLRFKCRCDRRRHIRACLVRKKDKIPTRSAGLLRLRRCARGGPNTRLNARLNAASDS